MPSSPLPLTLAVLTLSGALLSACGGSATSASSSPRPTASSRTSPSPTPGEGSPDLTAVREAGRAAEASGSGSFEQYLTDKADDTYVTKRTGRFVTASRSSQVVWEFPDEQHDGQYLTLGFLFSPTQVLMDNATVTATTGKKWTRLPSSAFATFGVDLTGKDFGHLPIGDMLDQAHGPVQALSPGDGEAQAYEVHVPEASVVALAGVSLPSLAAKGVDVTTLPQSLTRDVVLQVGLDAQGRLASLSADATDLMKDVAVLLKEDASGEGQVAAQLYVKELGSTLVDVPAPSEIGDLPAGS